MQSKMFNVAYNSQQSFILKSPTGSGKTSVAALCILKSVKSVYCAPTKALLEQAYASFIEMRFKNTQLITSDCNGSVNGDLIFTTPEKLSFFLIHDIIKTDCVILDEIHYIHSEDRGFLYEIILQQIKQKQIRVIGMSATYRTNIHLYMGCELHQFTSIQQVTYTVKNQFQPKVYNANSVFAQYKELAKLLVHDLTGQCIIFVPTRKLAEDVAQIISSTKKPFISQIRIKNETLQHCLQNSVGFHHAGLLSSEKQLVENMFIAQQVQTIVSTSTLQSGIDFDCDQVFIFGTKCYKTNQLENYELDDLLQMAGRCGRLKPGKCTIISDGDFFQSQFEGVSDLLYFDLKTNAQKSQLMNKFDDYILIMSSKYNSVGDLFEKYAQTFSYFQIRALSQVQFQEMLLQNKFLQVHNSTISQPWLYDFSHYHMSFQLLESANSALNVIQQQSDVTDAEFLVVLFFFAAPHIHFQSSNSVRNTNLSEDEQFELLGIKFDDIIHKYQSALSLNLANSQTMNQRIRQAKQFVLNLVQTQTELNQIQLFLKFTVSFAREFAHKRMAIAAQKFVLRKQFSTELTTDSLSIQNGQIQLNEIKFKQLLFQRNCFEDVGDVLIQTVNGITVEYNVTLSHLKLMKLESKVVKMVLFVQDVSFYVVSEVCKADFSQYVFYGLEEKQLEAEQLIDKIILQLQQKK